MPHEFDETASVLDRKWEMRGGLTGAVAPLWLADGTFVPSEVVMVALGRGATDVAAFLHPTLRSFMPDPSCLDGMDTAAARFCDAIQASEKIAVLGDYDVDGATSTALLLRYQRLVGLEGGIFHIPQRLTEGYGPNIPAIQKLRDEGGASLLVIADSGTGAFSQISHAREIGMDVIVIDHHEANADGRVPDAAVVNPKLLVNDGSLSHLCTAGLAFLFLVAANRELRRRGFFSPVRPEPDLRDLLGLVALGTVADVVPLRTLNRAYVAQGLAHMHKIPGLLALHRVINEGQREAAVETGKQVREVGYTSYACGFNFGPCINAAGRISDTRLGTLLLSTDDHAEASALAEKLFALNRERQTMQKKIVDSCIEKVEDRGPDDAVLVVYDEAWHPGVVGLGASKVKDRFDRSAVVIGEGGKGSGRGVDGFNIGQAFLKAAAEGLLVKGGGHSAAAGLTILPSKVDEFRAFMQEQSKGITRPRSQVDLCVAVGGLSIDSVRSFEMLAPFGMGNSHARVAFTGGVLDKVQVFKGTTLRAYLFGFKSKVKIIMFNAPGTPLGDALIAAEGHYVDILGDVEINTYEGRSEIQVKPTDAMIGQPATALANQAA